MQSEMVPQSDNDKRVQNYIKMKIQSCRSTIRIGITDYTNGSSIRNCVADQCTLEILNSLTREIFSNGFVGGLDRIIEQLSSDLLANRTAPNSTCMFYNAVYVTKQYVFATLLRELKDIRKLYQ